MGAPLELLISFVWVFQTTWVGYTNLAWVDIILTCGITSLALIGFNETNISWFIVGVEIGIAYVTCSLWNNTYDGTLFILTITCIYYDVFHVCDRYIVYELRTLTSFRKVWNFLGKLV